MVYFVQCGDGGPIKIGYVTGNCLEQVEKRIYVLQVGSPYPLKLLLVMAGAVCKERSLQKQFAHLHIRGEWFKPEPALLAYIQEQASVPFAEGFVKQEGETSVTCVICQTVFIPERAGQKFCSVTCRGKRICIVCGTHFIPESWTKRLYCSKACYYKGH